MSRCPQYLRTLPFRRTSFVIVVTTRKKSLWQPMSLANYRTFTGLDQNGSGGRAWLGGWDALGWPAALSDPAGDRRRRRRRFRDPRSTKEQRQGKSRLEPEGGDAMQVQPYLFFEGRCEEAIELYRNALGAE